MLCLMLEMRWWLTLLLPFALTCLNTASCTLQLQPITTLAGWQAAGSWALNGPRTVAAGSVARSDAVHILQHLDGTWLLADVISPPEPDVATFVSGSALLSKDGRLLAVAASSKAENNSAAAHTLTVGYLYRVVAQHHSPHAFKYQLAQRLEVPLHNGHSTSSARNSSTSSSGQPSHTTAHLRMAADGSTLLACWGASSDMQDSSKHPASSPIASAAAAAAAAAGAAAVASQQSPAAAASSGGAAVFTWKAAGQQSRTHMLTAPKGSASFGDACQLSTDGATALVQDGTRGALVYQLESQSTRRMQPTYRAAGWLAGAAARQQYHVGSVGLSPSGQVAALLVTQGLLGGVAGAGSRGRSTIKVFVADGYGHWAGRCDIQLDSSDGGAGDLQLAAFPGGVHVLLRKRGGGVLMFAVGLDGPQATQCPNSPMLVSVAQPAAPPAQVQQAQSSGAARKGQLRIEGHTAVYIASE